MRLSLTFASVVLSLASAPLLAQTASAKPPTPRERIDNRRDLREDHRETATDRWDLARLEKVQAEYKAAIAQARPGVVKALDHRFLAELNLEIGESKVEVAEKGQEVREARREKNEERREVVKDVVKGQPIKALRDGKDLADDKRDLAGDKIDRAVERGDLAKKRALRDRYVPLVDKLDGPALAQKLSIIDETIALAKKEIQGDRLEIREDRKEIREDRRDTRHRD